MQQFPIRGGLNSAHHPHTPWYYMYMYIPSPSAVWAEGACGRTSQIPWTPHRLPKSQSEPRSSELCEDPDDLRVEGNSTTMWRYISVYYTLHMHIECHYWWLRLLLWPTMYVCTCTCTLYMPNAYTCTVCQSSVLHAHDMYYAHSQSP